LKSRLLIITLAVLLAVLGAVAVLAYARQANERATAGLKTVTVITAKAKIASRTSLGTAAKDGLLSYQKEPADSISSDALRTTDGLTALVFDATVEPGQVLLRPMLVSSAEATATGGLDVPPGTQVITVQMCAAEALDGYLTAGSDVEVYATVQTSFKVNMQRTCGVNHSAIPPGNSQTVVVLPRVLVLSVTQGQSSTQSSAVSTAINSVVPDPASSTLSQGAVAVTFAVPLADVEKLIEATQVDLPYLALLQPNS
jgi:pilus assembly protein CpaB